MLTVARKPAARPARLGRCPQRAESPPGFTLMELLVSFSLIGLVAVFIHLGYSIGLSAQGKGRGFPGGLPGGPGLHGRPQPPDRFHGPLRLQPGARGKAGAGPALPGLPPEPGLRDHLVGRLGLRRGAAVRAGTLRPPPTPTPTPTPTPAPTPTPPPPAAACCSTNGRCPPRPGCGAPSSGASPKPRTTVSWPIWLRPGPAPAPSPWPRVWLRWPSGGWPGRKRRASRSAPGSIRAVSGAGSRRAARPQLPAGIQLSLRWNGQGPWGSKDFVLAVPVGGH